MENGIELLTVDRLPNSLEVVEIYYEDMIIRESGGVRIAKSHFFSPSQINNYQIRNIGNQPIMIFTTMVYDEEKVKELFSKYHKDKLAKKIASLQKTHDYWERMEIRAGLNK